MLDNVKVAYALFSYFSYIYNNIPKFISLGTTQLYTEKDMLSRSTILVSYVM